MSHSLTQTITEVSTPGNVSLPAEGSAPEKSGAPKGSGTKVSPPSQSTSPASNFKSVEKAGNSTKKTKGRRADKGGAAETADEPTTVVDPGKKILSPEKIKEDDLLSDYDEEIQEEEEETTENIPMTKAAMAKAVVGALQEMDKEEIAVLLDVMTEASKDDDEDEDDDDDDDDSDWGGNKGDFKRAKNKKGVRKKTGDVDGGKYGKGGHYKDDEENNEEVSRHIEASDLNLNADLAAILSDDDTLSEDFKNNARILFESAVVSKVNETIDQLEENYQSELTEAIGTISNELTEKTDGYLNYVVEEWMKENELAVERGIRSEITQEFVEGLKNLFQEHYIDMPEEKVDVAEALADKVDSLESQLNAVVESNIELQKEINESLKHDAVNSLTDDLADTESEKLKSLAEGIEFDDVDQYREALGTIRNKYFPKGQVASSEETLEEGLDITRGLTGSMAAYSTAIDRTVKR